MTLSERVGDSSPPILHALNMSNKQYLLIVGLIGAALWAALRFSTQKNSDTTLDHPLPEQSTANALPSAPTSESPSEATTPLPLLGPHLRKISECLQIQNTPNDSAELSFMALQSSLRSDLGEVASRELDWKNVHLTLPNGEKRRIRLEVEPISEEASGLRLKYYGVDSEELPIPLPLPENQSLNPSEAFIASLEGEGQITLREEAHRGIYTKGSELYYVERNGTLSELEINHLGKSVKCQNLQSPKGSCNCF